jgi:hypothetical protein
MRPVDELRITIDDALEQARRIAAMDPGHHVALVVTNLEEALRGAESIESPDYEPTE